MIATIEPFHGNAVVVNPEGDAPFLWSAGRVVLDESLAEGHALATADFLGLGHDQVIAGWRKPNAENKVGIRLYVPQISPAPIGFDFGFPILKEPTDETRVFTFFIDLPF